MDALREKHDPLTVSVCLRQRENEALPKGGLFLKEGERQWEFFSRLNEQQKKQTEAENAMPGAYENRYDEGHLERAGKHEPAEHGRHGL